MSKSAELAHLFRALKAPAAAEALPKLAGRARGEAWGHGRFAEALPPEPDTSAMASLMPAMVCIKPTNVPSKPSPISTPDA